MNNNLLCKSTVLHANDHKENKSIDIYMDSCYFISSWLIVQKTILNKKNHLTCDHTMREVLTTSNHYLQTHRDLSNIVI